MTPTLHPFSHTDAVSLCCPRCTAELTEGEQSLDCAGCGASYPVRDGVPRFSGDDYYWGEIPQADARALVDTAINEGWQEAVARQFAPTDDAWIDILDWQRASWIPLLELPKESAVLDVGSGYGAITHALAEHFGEVHAIEAVTERVDFTRVRLEQSGCDNVRLVQANALDLPYPPGSFDAIILNGVFEWIGDWDLEGTPREAQLKFLRRARALLKPNGRVLIGVDNRFQYASLAGGRDHSGLPFTNLLPRPLANVVVRAFGKPHHHMATKAQSYRTYTYTARGYRALFRDAGFEHVDPFWAEPSFNQPYRLTPLDNANVLASLYQLQYSALPRPVSLLGKVKRVFAKAGLFKYMIHDFVFILQKSDETPQSWRSMLPRELRVHPERLLTTYKFAKKTTIRVKAPGERGVVVKCSTPTEDSRIRVASEYASLESMARIARQNPSLLPFQVSTPLGSADVGRQLITLESQAPGDEIQSIISGMPAAEQLTFLRRYLPRLAEAAGSIARLGPQRQERTTAASWLDAVQTVVDPILSARAAAIGDRYRGWMGHGDLTLENCILDRETNALTIIDWEFVRDGVPPLFDLFTLYLSVLNSTTPSPEVFARFNDLQLARFYTLFFHENDLSRLLAECTAREFDRLQIDRSRAWQLFEDSLLFRVGYLVERRSNVSASRIRLLSVIHDWKPQFQL